MAPRLSLLVATALLLPLGFAGPICAASPHLQEIATRVVAYGEGYLDEQQGVRRFDEQSGFVLDWNGRPNLAETTLNYAAALFETGQGPVQVARIIGAVMGQQDRDPESATTGLFRWFAEDGAEYEVSATLYLAPVLAHLGRELSQAPAATGALPLEQSCRLALDALLARPPAVEEEVGALMYAGAVCSLGAALGESAGQERGVAVVRQWLASVAVRGPARGHRLTFDGLKIGGLRWAWQNALAQAARADAETALQLAYRDLLQRYHPAAATVGGAIEQAYPADYTGAPGVARYLLAADLPSALNAAGDLSPLAMYFALADYQLSPRLRALALERDQPYEVRTRSPVPEQSDERETTTCTYVTPDFTLGTMSGPVGGGSVPVLATWDLGDRPTSYFYLIGPPAHLSSVHSGSLALCSFNFDGVGVARRHQVAVRGILGLRGGMGPVLVDGHEWIGDPEALAPGSTVALQRGSSYLGVKILECGFGDTGRLEGDVKPGSIAWVGEGEDAALMLDVYGRQADYPLRTPLENVRVGLLIEVAPQTAYDTLSDFLMHVAQRRVVQQIRQKKERVRELEESQPGHRHDPRTKQEMVFVRSCTHSMALRAEDVTLGLVEDLLDNRLISQTLPVELPPDYLWLSPALSLDVGGSLQAALAP